MRSTKVREMKLYKAEQIAEILNVSKQTVWRYGRTGKLKKINVGRTVRYALPEMEKRKCLAKC